MPDPHANVAGLQNVPVALHRPPGAELQGSLSKLGFGDTFSNVSSRCRVDGVEAPCTAVLRSNNSDAYEPATPANRNIFVKIRFYDEVTKQYRLLPTVFFRLPNGKTGWLPKGWNPRADGNFWTIDLNKEGTESASGYGLVGAGYDPSLVWSMGLSLRDPLNFAQERQDLKGDKNLKVPNVETGGKGLSECVKNWLSKFFDRKVLDQIRIHDDGLPAIIPKEGTGAAVTSNQDIFTQKGSTTQTR